MIQRLLHGLACYLLLVPSIQAAEVAPFSDDFSNLELSQRRALRGAWHFRDGTASCTQDDALFKKHKDHGPILFDAHRAYIRKDKRLQRSDMLQPSEELVDKDVAQQGT